MLMLRTHRYIIYITCNSFLFPLLSSANSYFLNKISAVNNFHKKAIMFMHFLRLNDNYVGYLFNLKYSRFYGQHVLVHLFKLKRCRDFISAYFCLLMTSNYGIVIYVVMINLCRYGYVFLSICLHIRDSPLKLLTKYLCNITKYQQLVDIGISGGTPFYNQSDRRLSINKHFWKAYQFQRC